MIDGRIGMSHLCRIYPLHGSHGWAPVIGLGKLVSILHCRMLVGHLHTGGLYVVFSHGTLLHYIRSCVYTATTTIIAYMVVDDGISPYYRPVNIGIVDHRTVYVNHRSVIPEVTTRPTASGKTYAEITASVINASIEANL